MRACVTDGITMGFWTCSASELQLKTLDPNSTATHCEQPLDKVNHRYCPAHHLSLGNMCPAQPCVAPIEPGHKTCANPEHRDAHDKFKERNTSMFGLPRRFNRPNTHLQMDPSVLLSAETGEVALSEEELLYAEVQEREHEGARDGGTSKPPKKVLISRCRSHNEQLMVAPCGMILARKTFYKSESVTKVKVSYRNDMILPYL